MGDVVLFQRLCNLSLIGDAVLFLRCVNRAGLWTHPQGQLGTDCLSRYEWNCNGQKTFLNTLLQSAIPHFKVGFRTFLWSFICLVYVEKYSIYVGKIDKRSPWSLCLSMQSLISERKFCLESDIALMFSFIVDAKLHWIFPNNAEMFPVHLNETTNSWHSC